MFPNPEKPEESQAGEVKTDLSKNKTVLKQSPECQPVGALLKEAEASPELVLAESGGTVASAALTVEHEPAPMSASSPLVEETVGLPCSSDLVNPTEDNSIARTASQQSDEESQAVADSRLKIFQNFHEVSKAGARVSEGRLDRKLKHHLLAIIANPHALEHEWQRACTLLGDHKVRSNNVSYKGRVRLAMTASWLVLLYLPYLYCTVPKSYDFLKDLSRPQAAHASVGAASDIGAGTCNSYIDQWARDITYEVNLK